MVYEWVRLDTPSENDTKTFLCNSGVAIAKGTLLTLIDAKRVGAHSAAAQMIAGVAAMDKANNDYSTTISVWTRGDFDATCSGAISIGQAWEAAAQANTIRRLTPVTTSGAGIGGHVLEEASAAEVANVRLAIGGGAA